MEAQYKTRDGRLLVKVEAENQKGLFRELAAAQEVFESESECGCCHSQELRFRVRVVDENEFYELACHCGARFEFGQHKKGGSLFPKRRAEDGSALPNRGWAKWEPAAAAPPPNNGSNGRNQPTPMQHGAEPLSSHRDPRQAAAVRGAPRGNR